MQQKYKTRYGRVDKVIHWESYEKLKFDPTKKFYMNNPESILETETHKLLWDFKIQTDHLILTRRSKLVMINKKKKTCRIMDCTVSANHRLKLKENERKDKYLDLARELKKLWNMNVTVIPIVIGALGHQRLATGTGRLSNRRASGNHPNCSIIKIGENDKKCPGDWGDLLSLELKWETIG